jgi:hypothetical protein
LKYIFRIAIGWLRASIHYREVGAEKIRRIFHPWLPGKSVLMDNLFLKERPEKTETAIEVKIKRFSTLNLFISIY